MVKYGVADYGMDVWFGDCFSLEKRLVRLKEIGYDGIEWLKGKDTVNAFQNAITFHRNGMDFASCSMPSPEMSCQCACAFGKKYVWGPVKGRDADMDVYLRHCNAFCEAAASYGVVSALHNHMGCRIESQEELDLYMEKVPAGQLLLDVGHLAGAGGDCIEVIEKYADRIAAVHFKGVVVKDPNETLAVWHKRYRLCGMLEDQIGIDFPGIVKALKKIDYSGWFLVEHDTHLRDPYLDLAENLAYLKKLWEA